jgi:hypothetical protein
MDDLFVSKMRSPGGLASARATSISFSVNGHEAPEVHKMATDDNTRSALIAMLESGQCTQAEAARLAGRARQTVAQWIPGLDTTAAREAWLKRKLERRLKLRGQG